MIRSAPAPRGRRRGRLPTIAAMRILIANDDGYLAPGLAALVEACEGLGELDVVAPEQNASGTSNSLTLEPRPLSVYAAVQRLSLHQRHAVRLRPPRADRPARAPARPGRLRHQQRREHGRRHALFGHRRRGDGGLPVRHSGDRVLAGRRRAGRTSTPPRRGRAQRHRARAARSRRRSAPCLLNVNIPNRADADRLPRAHHPPRAGATRASR